MSNPLMGLLGGGMPGNGGMNPLSMLQGMQNPAQFAQQLLNSNPQARQFMEQMQNMANGRNPKEFAMQLAKQNGMSEQDIMSFAQKMGAK